MSIELRPYQNRTVTVVHDALRRVRRVLCCSPTGSGKRIVAVWWTLIGSAKGRRILVVTDRRILVEQMAEECKARGVSYGIVMGDSPRNDEALVQIASIQTLKHRKWKDMPEANLILHDECFPAGTLIDGIPIEEVKVGDVISSYNHASGEIEQRRVLRTFSRDVDRMARVWFNDGRSLECTINHPVFVREIGRHGQYIPAHFLSLGSEVVTDGNECVLSMRQGVHGVQEKAWSEGSLLEGVQVDSDRVACGRYQQEVCVGSHEGEQPDGAPRDSSEDGSKASRDRAQAICARRKRPRDDSAGGESFSDARMGSDHCSDGQGSKKGGTTEPLQDRPGESFANGGCGDRRSFTRQHCEEGTGPSQAGILTVTRLDCYSLLEQAGGCERAGVRGACRVYNLEVEGNNNYFANGVLVHNCHQQSEAFGTLFDLHPAAKVIGLTATPVGAQGRSLIGLYDELVEPVRNTELIQAGYLLRTHVLAPSEPDIAGVTIQDGKEFNQQQLGEKVEECTVFADVFKWWEPFSGLQTLCFVPRIKYAYGLAEQFQQHGFAAEVIEGGTSKKERHALFEDYRAQQKRVLISVDVLREGLDLPIAQVGIDLQPNSQFRTWWQKLGRIRRPHEGQAQAVWLDFSGNVWRHVLHPDADPPWDEVTSNLTTKDVLDKKAGRVCPDCGSTKIFKGKCQECGKQIVPTKAPWCCPNCSYSLSPWERLTDGKCPNCHQKVGKAVRRIRMANGKMRSVSMEEVSTVKRERSSMEQQAWDRWWYRAYHSGKTLEFARQMYKREMGRWPPNGMPGMPADVDSGDWKRPVKAVYHLAGRRKIQAPPPEFDESPDMLF